MAGGIRIVLPAFRALNFTICILGFSAFASTTYSQLLEGTMVNSCVCKVDGKIYNLTALGDGGPSALSFVQTREAYDYLIKICTPFNYPPLKGHQPINDQKSNGFTKKQYLQPLCRNASLCQADYYGSQRQYKIVTSQQIKNNELRCFKNSTTGSIQWKYKGVSPLFSNGGLVLTLICGKASSKGPFKAVYDVDRRKGNPWKYVNVTHKCCCANTCRYVQPTNKPTTTSPPEKEDLLLEICLGAGFCVMILLIVVMKICQNRLHERQPILPKQPNQDPYGTFIPNPQLRKRTIPYEEITNIRKIGEGAYGIVSKGTWRGSDVAVKRIKEHVIDEDMESFIKESTWLCNLANRHIVQFYGICTIRPNICIITEYMKGGSVADIIHKQRKQLSWEKRIKWASDAAKGMAFLHSNKPQVIHRDLKSDNLLVDERDFVKIADFGALKLLRPLISRQITRENERRINTPDILQDHANRSHDTLWAGTLRWSAPEVIPRRGVETEIKYTTKSDVYSFAVTMWEMITNKRPYHYLEWDYQIMNEIENGIPPEIPEGCPEKVVQLLENSWHINPDRRPEISGILFELQKVRLSDNPAKPRTI